MNDDEEEKLAYLGITKKELEEAQFFEAEYEFIQTQLKKMLDMQRIEEFRFFLEDTLKEFYSYNKYNHDKYMQLLDDYENFDIDDYNPSHDEERRDFESEWRRYIR